MSDPIASMVAGLEKKTGKTLDWWVGQAEGAGSDKHSEMVNYLKTEHGLGHGHANFVVLTLRERMAGGPPSEEDLIEAQYKGKEALIPTYERLLAAAKALGSDVEVAPKKTSVSLRRSKQFALIEPASKTRIDLGLNLKGLPGDDRLKAVGGMCTHKVGITGLEDVDDDVLSWLGQAYEMA